MRRGSKRSSYAERPRHVQYMLWVKTLPCSVAMLMGNVLLQYPCAGCTEADHDSRGRGLSHKSHDSTVVPMCTTHHVHRTMHTGVFKHCTRDEVRAFMDAAHARVTAEAQAQGVEIPMVEESRT